MTGEGHKVASLHGSKEATDRDSVMDRFRDGQDKVLITTNVIARGIDIPQVNMVVNYDLPMMSERQQEPGVNDRLDLIPDVETYIHRIGMEPPLEPLPQIEADLIHTRTYGPVRQEGYLCKLRAQPKVVPGHDDHPTSHWQGDHKGGDRRLRYDGRGRSCPRFQGVGHMANVYMRTKSHHSN